MTIGMGPDPKKSAAARASELPTLSERQDNEVNYFVIVPFTTSAAAEWAAGHIGASFDCHVISSAAVDPNAPLVASVVGEADG